MPEAQASSALPFGSIAKPRIGIIVGSIRPNRFADIPAQWIHDVASDRTDLDFEIVDLRDYPLPLFGEHDSASTNGASSPDAVEQWRAKLDELDGYIFLTAEYNHGITSALKNALDHAYREYNRKPAAFVGYGGVGGARAVEQLRLICCELQIAPVRTAVHIGTEPFRAARNGQSLADFDYLNQSASAMLDELAWWARTLKAGREEFAGVQATT